MRLNLEGTTLQSNRNSIPLYGDSFLVPDAEAQTMLPGLFTEESSGQILVHVSVIRRYQEMILRLETQIMEYRALLRQLRPRPGTKDEPVSFSEPINEASTRVLNSIFHAQISEESILRAYDEEE